MVEPHPGASGAHSPGPTDPTCICVSTPSCLLAGPLPPDTSGSVPTLGFLRGGHTSQSEASHLLECDLAPQPCLSGLSRLLFGQSNPPPPNTHTSTYSRLLPPRGLPRPYHNLPPPPITTHLCTSGSPLYLPARPDSNRWRHQTDLLLLPTSGGGQPSLRTLEKALVCLLVLVFIVH